MITIPAPQRLFTSLCGYAVVIAVTMLACLWTLSSAHANEKTVSELRQTFTETVVPFLRSYCLDCHGEQSPEAMLDLSEFRSIESISAAHPVWEIVLERLEANEMPPEDVANRPSQSVRDTVINWIKGLRKHDASLQAGDPGPVLARRLSNNEYNYTIRDLTHVDIQPTRTFPVDPANTAGFDNTGESLTMSPALLKKYLGAAREVAEHLVLTPTDLRFAPHPVVTDTDRDKYCVKRIVEFYQAQPTALAPYFLTCWKIQQHFRTVDSLEKAKVDERLADLATRNGVSPKYTQQIWDILHQTPTIGPTSKLQQWFQSLATVTDEQQAQQVCLQMQNYILEIRPQLSRQFENLMVEGNHRGSQPFVLWKNEQYATHRQKLDRNRLYAADAEIPDGVPQELLLPKEEQQRAQLFVALEEFCAIFPDQFYIEERGRDYLDVPKEKQEKGRLLSAGFHSMMGYFRDDAPLYDLILDETEQQQLDQLWQELDFVASAPARQYVGFLWFERTDSRYMRDPEFDFARAEDKNAASAEMIHRLAEIYLDKALRSGGTGNAIQAIKNYFVNIDQQIRWVETERLRAEPLHLQHLLRFTERAWRRALTSLEKQDLLEFYRVLREEDHLDHEEALRDCVVSILMSPHFLYRLDLASPEQSSQPLSAEELASRLSYFLWSTMPDDELLAALRQSADNSEQHSVLLQQTERMLQDEKIAGLAKEFAANWLDIRRFEEHNSVDRERFPQFTDELRQAMFEEPLHYFTDLVQHDRSVLTLLDGRGTFVNRVLANHYGMQDLDFSNAEWIHLEDARRYDRGGLLPMSVFLTTNSPGLRTSPVKRGYWVVRRLLGERIPAPPPNVPDLPEDESQLGDLSLREVLARHREHKSCAGCHNRIDSFGLAFEGFGPIGERRELDLGGRPVETAVTFPNGEVGTGLTDLQSYLKAHRQQDFVDNLCRKLLSYALGRSLILSDDELIATMQEKLVEENYRFSSLFNTIVTSRQFLHKRGRE